MSTSALRSPSLSVCLSLTAVSLCPVCTAPLPCPPPQQGLPALPQEPCLLFPPAAQVLPQRAPDAAGAEGGAGLPLPECELRSRAVRQHRRWLGRLRGPRSLPGSLLGGGHAPSYGRVRGHHTHHPQNSVFPPLRPLLPLLALRAVGILLPPKSGGGGLFADLHETKASRQVERQEGLCSPGERDC